MFLGTEAILKYNVGIFLPLILALLILTLLLSLEEKCKYMEKLIQKV